MKFGVKFILHFRIKCAVNFFGYKLILHTNMILGIFFIINTAAVASIIILLLISVCLRKWLQYRRLKFTDKNKYINVGIFHPYCNSGGGGERVLWCAIQALQAKFDNIRIIVYTGDNDATPLQILRKVKDVFNITVEEKTTNFVYLKRRHLIDCKTYPHLTLLGQSIGSIILGVEALWKFTPDIYVDTMGYAFTHPLFRFIGCCKVACYVHYPTISTDMLRKVKKREVSNNNKNYVVRNPFLTWLKLTYYEIFAKIYSLAGRCSDSIMVNSSWTENHILELWNVPFKTHRVYPPCNVTAIKSSTQKVESNKIIILSVGQFRPEKNHPLQLQAMYELRNLLIHNEQLWNKFRLIIVGSCRNSEDDVRLKNIQDLCKHLSLEDNVEFKVNVPYSELLKLYGTAKIGIHTMWNEHFGIGIVECMAAGMIVIAHNSGGPLLDIIETSEGSQNGYLATDAIEYANYMLKIACDSEEFNDSVRFAAISSVDRFSDKEFEINFIRAISPVFNNIVN